ncbi:MAG: sigma-70 family RNA polymerase sigma factor [Chthoniobacterales bacterium]
MDNPPEQQLEMELLRRTAQGDRASFEALYERFSGILFTAALRVLNDQREAEDILQDVFIQIWEKAHFYVPERGKPLTWALTLTRNKSIDRLRSLQRRARLRDQVENETEIKSSLGQRDSSDEVDSLEKGKIIRAAVMQLSQEQREAIEMAYFGGLTQIEIASRLDQPLGTVKARIRRGMMRLKDLVENQL